MASRTNTPVSLKNPAKLTELFYKETHNRNEMTKEQFRHLTGCKSEIFGNKLFDTLDATNRGTINIGDMMEGFAKLHASSTEERIRYVFGIFDLDEDGVITRADLETAIRASVEESGSEVHEDEMNTLVKALLQLFDSDGKDDVQLEDFARVLRNYPDLLQGMTFGSFGKIHSVTEKRTLSRRWAPSWMKEVGIWTIENPQYVLTYGLAIALLLISFFWMFLKFSGDCDEVDMDLRDPLTGYTRRSIAELVEQDGGALSEEDQRYMVFSDAMSRLDSITCRDGRKRRLLSWSLPVAKGCAQAMKVTFTLILIPVSRTLMTTLRETFLKQFFIFDGAIGFHKFLGRVGFWLAWTHTLCHVAGILNWRDPDRFKYWSWAFPDKRTLENMEGILRDSNDVPILDDAERPMPNGDTVDGLPKMILNTKDQPTGEDLVFSVVALTGLVLILVYTIAAMFAFDYPKKLSIFKATRQDETGNLSFFRNLILRIGRSLNDFNNFWYSHHLFSVFYLALLIHPLPKLPDTHHEAGTNDTWMWIGIPLLVYLIERCLRVRRSARNTRVLGLELLPGNVIGLKMHRPKGLRYTPGQYVFINCPQISRFEWHPFTLTSCPGDSYLGVHIRKAGDWTGALYELGHSYLSAKASSSAAGESITEAQSDLSRYLVKPVVGDQVEVVERFPFDISVDGPFGAPAQNYSDYKVIVLIGAGIGVTPFASVLTDLLDALQSCECPHCGRMNFQHMRLQLYKAYFYWTVRSRSEASWFKHLLEAIAQRDTGGLLEININITGIKGAQDLRTMMLSLAQYENAMETASDPHSRAITRFGRINWTSVFDKVVAEFPNESSVGVFYCGPNRLAKHLAELCRENSVGSTKFSFMRESFG